MNLPANSKPAAPPTDGQSETLGFWRRVGRSLRLRCPRCGQGRLFSGLITMHDRCDTCGLDIRREPGFYLGSIYFNYGLTALVVTIVYVTALAQGYGRSRLLLWGTMAFCIVFPLWFFRYARSLWLGMDHYVDREVREPPQSSTDNSTCASRKPTEAERGDS